MWIDTGCNITIAVSRGKMKYNCHYCKKELDTMLSIMRCPTCKADVNESIEIADRQYMEEQRDLKADAERRRGFAVNDRRAGRIDDRV